MAQVGYLKYYWILHLYNNINKVYARTMIGQSAIVYCAGITKSMRVLWLVNPLSFIVPV